MSLLALSPPDIIGTAVGFLLTVAVFSYLFRDNAIFRLAIHLFIGAAAGLAAAIILYNVIWPRLIEPFLSVPGDFRGWLLLLAPVALVILLLMKTSARTSAWGSPVMAFLTGVGAATAVGGAVLGTLLPQTVASMNIFEAQKVQLGLPSAWYEYLNAIFLLVVTIATLVYFQFGWRPALRQEAQDLTWVDGLAWVGKVTISVTLGVILAGILIASLSALVERIDFLLSFLLSLIGL